MSKKTSPDIEKQVIDLYNIDNKSYSEISNIIGFSSRIVKSIIINNTYIVNMIINLYVHEEKNSIEISKMFHVSDGIILKILKKNNIKCRTPSERNKRAGHYKVNKTMDHKIIDFYCEKFMTLNECGKHFNVSGTTIKNILTRNGVKIRNQIEVLKLRPKLLDKLPIQDIIKLYCIENKSSIWISQKYGCSKKVIINILHNNGIKIRKKYDYKYTHPKNDDIIKYYSTGIGIELVAKKLEISYQAVRLVLLKNNLVRSEKSGNPGPWSDGQRNNFYKSRTGFTIDVYLNMLPDFIRYKTIVMMHTNKQKLHLLDNFNKRGKYEYHLDHKYSIASGFKNNINPELIGNINNLEMLTWQENISKNNKCSITIDQLINLTNNVIPIYWNNTKKYNTLINVK